MGTSFLCDGLEFEHEIVVTTSWLKRMILNDSV